MEETLRTARQLENVRLILHEASADDVVSDALRDLDREA